MVSSAVKFNFIRNVDHTVWYRVMNWCFSGDAVKWGFVIYSALVILE